MKVSPNMEFLTLLWLIYLTITKSLFTTIVMSTLNAVLSTLTTTRWLIHLTIIQSLSTPIVMSTLKISIFVCSLRLLFDCLLDITCSRRLNPLRRLYITRYTGSEMRRLRRLTETGFRAQGSLDPIPEHSSAEKKKSVPKKPRASTSRPHQSNTVKAVTVPHPSNRAWIPRPKQDALASQLESFHLSGGPKSESLQISTRRIRPKSAPAKLSVGSDEKASADKKKDQERKKKQNKRDVSFVAQSGFFHLWPATVEMGLNEETMAGLNQLNETLSAAVQSTERVAHHGLNTVTGYKNVMLNVVKVLGVCLLIVCCHVYLPANNTLLRMGVLTSLLVFFLPKELGIQINTVLQEPADEDEYVAQGYIDGATIGRVAQVLVIGLTWITGGPLAKDKVKSFLRNIGSISRGSEGLEMVLNLCLGFIQDIASWFAGERVEILESLNREVKLWGNKVKRLLDEASDGSLRISYKNAIRVNAVLTEGREMIAKCDRTSYTEFNYLKTNFSAIERLFTDMFSTVNFHSGVRPEPLMVMLRGSSGVGKSHACIPLLKTLLARVLDPEDLEAYMMNDRDFIYNRQAEHKYWDGYFGQFATVFDDFGQCIDIPGSPDNEFMDIIRCGNQFPNFLHMANLSSKGNVNFSSRIVLATSNMFTCLTQSIHQPEAVNRRWDMVADVCPCVAYCKEGTADGDPRERRLDVTKCRGTLDLDAYEFHMQYLQPGSSDVWIPGEVLNYHGFLDLMETKYNDKSGGSMDYLSVVDDLKAEAINARMNRFAAQTGIAEFANFVDDPSDRPTEPLGEVPRDYRRLDNAICNFRSIRLPLMWSMMRDLRFEAVRRPTWDMRPNWSVLQWWDVETIRQYHSGLIALYRTLTVMWTQRLTSNSDISEFDEKITLVMNRRNLPRSFVFTEVFRYALSSGIDPLEVDINSITFDDFMRETLSTPHYNENVRHLIRETRQNFMNDITNRVVDEAEAMRNQTATFSGLADHPLVTIGACIGVCLMVYTIVKGILGWRSSWFKKEPSKEKEGSFDPVGDDISYSVLRRNTFLLYHSPGNYHENKESGKCAGIFTCIDGRTIIGPAHYLHQMRDLIKNEIKTEKDTVVFAKWGTNRWWEITYSEVIEGAVERADRDIFMFRMPDRVPMMTSIRHHFVDEEKAKTLTSHVACNLVIPRAFMSRLTIPTRATHKAQLSSLKLSGKTEMVKNCYRYDAPTISGDCGSLLHLRDPTTGPQKILGFHLAGNSSESGFSGGITRELIDAMEAEFNEKDIVFTDQCDFTEQEIPVGGTLDTKFELPVGYPLYSSSSITRSLLYEAWGRNQKVPAVMVPVEREGAMIDPRQKSVTAYSGHTPFIDPDLVLKARDDYMSKLLPLLGHGGKVFSFEDAVTGIEGDEFRNGIPRSTSAGYPFCTNPLKYGKKKYGFFGVEGDYTLDVKQTQELKKDVTKVIEHASRGERCSHVYVDFLKDERRSRKKIDAVETRLISACPLTLLICFRMYFLDFVGYMMEKRNVNECSVGSNVYGPDWDLMRRMLTTYGPDCIAGDYSRFDSSQSPVINCAILDIINRYYEDGNDLIRKVLWEEINNSHHLYGNLVYDWDHSLPSGNPLTSIINSMYNSLVFRMAWIELSREAGFNGAFTDHVSLLAYGDDNAVNVHPEAIEFFNQITLSETFAKYGLTYTDENKSAEMVPSRPINEISFLKRKWRYEPSVGRYVGPLDMATILESPYWTKKGPDSVVNTIASFETQLCELSLHGKETFEEYFPMMAAASRERLGYYPLRSGWYETLQFALENDARLIA